MWHGPNYKGSRAGLSWGIICHLAGRLAGWGSRGKKASPPGHLIVGLEGLRELLRTTRKGGTSREALAAQEIRLFSQRVLDLRLRRIPRAAYVINTKLLGTGRPWRCLTESAGKGPRSGVVASELMVDSRKAGTWGAPTPVGLHVCRRGDDQRDRLSVGGVIVVAMPIRHLGTSQGSHKGGARMRLDRSDRETCDRHTED